jgi:hypothetical protein
MKYLQRRAARELRYATIDNGRIRSYPPSPGSK